MYLLWGVCCEKGEIGVDLMEWGREVGGGDVRHSRRRICFD